MYTLHNSKVNSNSRYPNFYQTHFTAGDYEQFNSNRNRGPSFETTTISEMEDNMYKDEEHVELSPLFHSLNATTVTTTFNYIFNKFKKGIFIQILDNKVSVMLPFSKHAYTNEWSSLVKYNFPDTLYEINRIEGRIMKPGKCPSYNTNANQWYANNALIRYEYPIGEGDSGVQEISDMFTELCVNRQVPNIEFFVNRRDFPILMENGTEAYNHLFGDNKPLVSHKYDKYSPILGMCKTDKYADILIPTWEDWRECIKPVETYVAPTFNEWNSRIETAVFRGASTGIGTTITTNMRLKIAKMSSRRPVDTNDDVPFLDAGITKWNARVRKNKDSPYLKTLEIEDMELVQYMSLAEQQRYKYIINIDGHVSAYRLSRELTSFCVILRVESDYKLWYSDKLVPYIHYVPVASDLSDIYSKILWCKSHPVECYNICVTARAFSDKYLCKDGIFDYLQFILKSASTVGGHYKYNESPLVRQSLFQKHRMALDVSKPLSSNPQIERVLHKNNNSEVDIVSINDTRYIYKQGSNLIHEAFIGLYCVNNILQYNIPNFLRTHGLINNDSELLLEYKETITFSEYLQSDLFTISDYMLILIQIALAVYQLQLSCLFVHNDLYPWNILIQILPEPIDVIYRSSDKDCNSYITVRSKIIPIIIDYGKSQGVCTTTRLYNSLETLRFSSVQDSLCILLSSMYTVIHKRTLLRSDLNALFTLSRFFSGGKYTNGVTFTTVKSLKQFVASAKKFSEMSSSDKYELSDLCPVDLARFIMTKFRVPCVHSYSYSNTVPMRLNYTIIPYVNLSYDFDIFDDTDKCKQVYSRVFNTLSIGYTHYTLEALYDVIYKASTQGLIITDYNIELVRYIKYNIYKDTFIKLYII